MVAILFRDDWELTLRELRSQRVQLTLSLAVLNAGIKAVEVELKKFPPKKLTGSDFAG